VAYQAFSRTHPQLTITQEFSPREIYAALHQQNDANPYLINDTQARVVPTIDAIVRCTSLLI